MKKLTLKNIVVVVAVVHCIVMIAVAVHSDFNMVFPAQEKIIVKTVTLKPPPLPVEKPVKERLVAAAPTPKKLTPKKQTPKVQTPKKQTPKPKPTVKNNPKKEELFAKAQEKWKQFQKKKTESTNIDDIVNIDSLSIDSIDENAFEDKGYYTSLACRLKEVLCLPECGCVNISLTLARDGKVEKIKVLDTDKPLNRQYVEKMLPSIRFPSFGKSFGKRKEHTFNIALKSST